jgi:hypothetical protein
VSGWGWFFVGVGAAGVALWVGTTLFAVAEEVAERLRRRKNED